MQEPEKKGRRRREASCHPHLLHTAQEYRPKNGDGTGREGDLERQNLQPKCPSQTSACNREPRASQAHPASLLRPCQQSPRVGTDPRRDPALAPAPQRPARCCLPGSPRPPQGPPPPPRQIHGDPSGWRRRNSPCRGRSSATKGPHRAEGLAADGRSLPAPGTKDQSGRRPRGRGRARPLKGRDEPPRCRSPGPPSRLAPHGRRGMEATYLSLRRRWLRVAARRPRGRALEPHTAPLARPRRRTPRPTPRAPAPPPPPTHWAGPRPPGPFKPGPYHRAGRGRPGRAERQGSRAGAAPPWGRERPSA